MHPEWLSNAYLVADEPGGRAVIIDSGAPAEPLIEAIERHGVKPEQLLLTHRHLDQIRAADHPMAAMLTRVTPFIMAAYERNEG